MAEGAGQGIILRLGHFREQDLWLRVLLAGRGTATLFAFGGARSKRRFSGCLDQFNTISCQVAQSRKGDYTCLTEATLLVAPERMRRDWRRLGAAVNCLRFAEACCIGPDTAAESFTLLEDLRSRLEQDEQPELYLPVFFRLRLAAILGFGPDFRRCAACGELIDSHGWFLPAEGQTFCPACSLRQTDKNQVQAVRLPHASLDLLASVRQSSALAWQTENIDPIALRQAGKAIDGLIQFHLGLEWHNGNFRRI